MTSFKILFTKIKNPFLHSINRKEIKMGNRGQAIIEYVLILTVIVLVFLGIMKPFAQAFERFGYSLVNHYSCLLQTGSLPFMAPDTCNIDNFDFNPDNSMLGSGPPGSWNSPDGGGTGSGGGPGSRNDPNNTDSGGSSSYDSNNPYSADNPYPDFQIPPPSSDTISSGTLTPIDTTQQNSAFSDNNSSNLGDPNSISSPNGSLISLNDREDTSSLVRDGSSSGLGKKKKRPSLRKTAGFSGYNEGYEGYQTTAIHSSGFFSEEAEQRNKSKPIPVSEASKKGGYFDIQKKQLLKLEKRKKKIKDTQIKKWSFGYLFRILLIICFIIALVLIIGSQVSQVQKSLK